LRLGHSSRRLRLSSFSGPQQGCRLARSPASASAAASAQEIKAIGSRLLLTSIALGKRLLARLSLGHLVQFFARLPSEDPFKATRSSFGLTEMVTFSLCFCSRPLIQLWIDSLLLCVSRYRSWDLYTEADASMRVLLRFPILKDSCPLDRDASFLEDDKSVLFQLSRGPTREPMPRKYREVAEPGAGRGHQSVNAMRPKQKTRQHTQSAPTRAMGREHQARGTERSRTHYLPHRGTRWSKGQLRFWFKNETRLFGEAAPKIQDVAALVDVGT